MKYIVYDMDNERTVGSFETKIKIIDRDDDVYEFIYRQKQYECEDFVIDIDQNAIILLCEETEMYNDIDDDD